MKDNSWLIILLFALVLIALNYCTKCDDRLKDITSSIDSISFKPDTFIVNKLKTDTILVNKFYVLRDTVRVIDTVRILREFGEYREYKIELSSVSGLIDLLYNDILNIELRVSLRCNTIFLNLNWGSCGVGYMYGNRWLIGGNVGYNYIDKLPILGINVGYKW